MWAGMRVGPFFSALVAERTVPLQLGISVISLLYTCTGVCVSSQDKKGPTSGPLSNKGPTPPSLMNWEGVKMQEECDDLHIIDEDDEIIHIL